MAHVQLQRSRATHHMLVPGRCPLASPLLAARGGQRSRHVKIQLEIQPCLELNICRLSFYIRDGPAVCRANVKCELKPERFGADPI